VSLFSAVSKIVTVIGAGISINIGIPVRISASLPNYLLLGLGLSIKEWRLFPRLLLSLLFLSSL